MVLIAHGLSYRAMSSDDIREILKIGDSMPCARKIGSEVLSSVFKKIENHVRLFISLRLCVEVNTNFLV